MKVLALCTVYEDDLKKVRDIEEGEDLIDAVAAEFCWVHDSGIILDTCKEAAVQSEDTEYQALVWDTEKEEFVPTGRTVHNELLCIAWLKSTSLPNRYDKTRFKIRKREVYTVATEWEEQECDPK